MERKCPLYELTQVRQVLEGLPHFRELGMKITRLERGQCAAHLEYDSRLIGNPDTGVVHGGVITTILDSVGGAAAFSVVEEGRSVATLDLRIDYLKPAEPERTIRGFAECYKLTRNVAFVRGMAYHDDAKDPIANCTASFMVGSVGFTVKREV